MKFPMVDLQQSPSRLSEFSIILGGKDKKPELSECSSVQQPAFMSSGPFFTVVFHESLTADITFLPSFLQQG